MTRVRVRVRVPGGDTGTLPAPGEILFQPTARHTNGDDIVLPAPMRCRLDPSGCTLVDLPPSQLPRWCWKAVERTLGGTTRWIDVPDSPDELEYAALTDVDPKTLQAKPHDESAWNALFQRIEDLVDDVPRISTGTPDTPPEHAGDVRITPTGDLLNAVDGQWDNVGNLTGPQGPKGDTGTQGPQGEPGANGKAATIQIGTVTTGDPGTDASVENVGTATDARLNFTIPRGADGTSGSGGSGGGLSSVTHDSTLLGDGTSSNPLKLAKGTILTLNGVDRNADDGKAFDLNDLLEGFTRVVGLKKNLLNLPNLDYIPGNYATGLALTTTVGSGNKIQLWFDAKTAKGKIHIRAYVQPNWTEWNTTSMQSDLNNYVPLSTYQALEARVQALEAKLANQ